MAFMKFMSLLENINNDNTTWLTLQTLKLKKAHYGRTLTGQSLFSIIWHCPSITVFFKILVKLGCKIPDLPLLAKSKKGNK